MSTRTSVRDPYTVLGVSRSATAEEIKRAYRDLAKKHHPDRNPNDKKAEARLKELNAANDFLSDAGRRRRYDAGEIDANGQELFAPGGFGGFGGGASANGPRTSRTHGRRAGSGARSFFDASDFVSEDILHDLFGARSRGGRGSGVGEGASASASASGARDVNYTLSLPFVEATLGGKRSIKLADGKEVTLTIPPGTVEGTRLRLKGQGQTPRFGGSAGDAYIQIKVEPHPLFTREGRDIRCEVPVSITEAVLGASIRVPTLGGEVEVKVPKGSNAGTQLRLKGKGVPAVTEDGVAGDQYVRLKLVLPDGGDDALADFLRTWKPGLAFNPRRKAAGGAS